MKNENIKGIAVPKSIGDIVSDIKLLCAYADIPEDVLVAGIKRVCDGLNRVGSPNSLAIVQVVDGALRSAQAHFAKVDRLSDLKALAVWVGSVQMGWV